jgi:DNA-binding response OmpR family regulator
LRILVLDGSRVLPSLVQRMLRYEDRVETTDSFQDARRTLMERPPDALIVNLTPTDLPWQELKDLCERHTPPIPVIYESCVFKSAADAGIGELNGCSAFLRKPYPLSDLRKQLRLLLRTSAPQHRATHRPAPPIAPGGP